jgi:hypothetical protein
MTPIDTPPTLEEMTMMVENYLERVKYYPDVNHDDHMTVAEFFAEMANRSDVSLQVARINPRDPFWEDYLKTDDAMDAKFADAFARYEQFRRLSLKTN